MEARDQRLGRARPGPARLMPSGPATSSKRDGCAGAGSHTSAAAAKPCTASGLCCTLPRPPCRDLHVCIDTASPEESRKACARRRAAARAPRRT